MLDGIFSFTRPTVTLGPQDYWCYSGTSMAAPQVTGLAAYLWSLRPNLTSDQILSHIINNAEKTVRDSTPLSNSPVIDAYATMLSADQPKSTDSETEYRKQAPARLAILDVNNDKVFDILDVQNLLISLFALNTGISPTAPDYSRWDLNGDGFTGGANHTARFNLDLDYDSNGGAKYGLVKAFPNGRPVVALDETKVTDFQVLCYYVNSKLFNNSDLAKVDQELQTLSTSIGRPISCSPTAVRIQVKDFALSGWTGIPGDVLMFSLVPMSRDTFAVTGGGGTCGGEMGGPVFSGFVDPSAVFFAVKVTQGVPFSTPFINRQPCSSFYARQDTIDGPIEWANATGRGQSFGLFTTDREFQLRYFSGRPINLYADKSCQIGFANVPFGNFALGGILSQCTLEANVVEIKE
jgi:hypothetical protein